MTSTNKKTQSHKLRMWNFAGTHFYRKHGPFVKEVFIWNPVFGNQLTGLEMSGRDGF